MKNLYKKIFCLIAVFCMLLNINSQVFATAAAPVKKPVAATNQVVYTSVSPLDVVNNASKYLNKNISFTGEFVAFTSLGLDYKPAYKDATKYIGILIKRPDVDNHTIPLSEMKIFVTREMAEKNVDIETGDKIKIEGKVFSTALGDPWVDAKTFTIISQKQKTNASEE